MLMDLAIEENVTLPKEVAFLDGHEAKVIILRDDSRYLAFFYEVDYELDECKGHCLHSKAFSSFL